MPTRRSTPNASTRRVAGIDLRRLALLSSVLLVGAALATVLNAQTVPPAMPAAPSVGASPDASARRPASDDGSMRLSSAQVQQAFQHIDANRDGILSRGEVGVYPNIERHFDRIDSNRDGELSPLEFETALQRAS